MEKITPCYTVGIRLDITKHSVKGDKVVSERFYEPEIPYFNAGYEEMVGVQSVLHEANGKLLAMGLQKVEEKAAPGKPSRAPI